MDVSGVHTHDSLPTGQVLISLVRGEPCFTILDNPAYDFISTADFNSEQNTGGLLYYGTLVLRNAVSRRALENLKIQKQSQIFLDVNLRQPWWSLPKVLHWVAEADWVKLNIHELNTLLPLSVDLHTAMEISWTNIIFKV